MIVSNDGANTNAETLESGVVTVVPISWPNSMMRSGSISGSDPLPTLERLGAELGDIEPIFYEAIAASDITVEHLTSADWQRHG